MGPLISATRPPFVRAWVVRSKVMSIICVSWYMCLARVEADSFSQGTPSPTFVDYVKGSQLYGPQAAKVEETPIEQRILQVSAGDTNVTTTDASMDSSAQSTSGVNSTDVGAADPTETDGATQEGTNGGENGETVDSSSVAPEDEGAADSSDEEGLSGILVDLFSNEDGEEDLKNHIPTVVVPLVMIFYVIFASWGKRVDKSSLPRKGDLRRAQDLQTTMKRRHPILRIVFRRPKDPFTRPRQVTVQYLQICINMLFAAIFAETERSERNQPWVAAVWVTILSGFPVFLSHYIFHNSSFPKYDTDGLSVTNKARNGMRKYRGKPRKYSHDMAKGLYATINILCLIGNGGTLIKGSQMGGEEEVEWIGLVLICLCVQWIIFPVAAVVMIEQYKTLKRNNKIMKQKEQEKRDHNATKIQAALRGHQARKEVKKLKADRNAIQQEEAAVKIQAVYRGHKTRVDLEEEQFCIIFEETKVHLRKKGLNVVRKLTGPDLYQKALSDGVPKARYHTYIRGQLTQ